jgi:hypothetical protein
VKPGWFRLPAGRTVSLRHKVERASDWHALSLSAGCCGGYRQHLLWDLEHVGAGRLDMGLLHRRPQLHRSHVSGQGHHRLAQVGSSHVSAAYLHVYFAFLCSAGLCFVPSQHMHVLHTLHTKAALLQVSEGAASQAQQHGIRRHADWYVKAPASARACRERNH